MKAEAVNRFGTSSDSRRPSAELQLESDEGVSSALISNHRGSAVPDKFVETEELLDISSMPLGLLPSPAAALAFFSGQLYDQRLADPEPWSLSSQARQR
jgi:hypothetical protein